MCLSTMSPPYGYLIRGGTGQKEAGLGAVLPLGERSSEPLELKTELSSALLSSAPLLMFL